VYYICRLHSVIENQSPELDRLPRRGIGRGRGIGKGCVRRQTSDILLRVEAGFQYQQNAPRNEYENSPLNQGVLIRPQSTHVLPPVIRVLRHVECLSHATREDQLAGHEVLIIVNTAVVA
jgi:hypothetical protein